MQAGTAAIAPDRSYSLSVSGSELVFGKSSNNYTVYYRALSTSQEAVGVRFSGKTVDFANATGARKTITDTPDVIEKETLKFYVTNGLNIPGQFAGWKVPDPNAEPGPEEGEGLEYSFAVSQKNASATGLALSSNTTVAGDFNAEVYTATGSDDAANPYHIDGYVEYYTHNYTYGTKVDPGFSSGNTLNAIAVSAGSLNITGNVSGGDVSASVRNYSFNPVYSALIDGNTLSAYGFKTGGMRVDGMWFDIADVTSEVKNIELNVIKNQMKQSASGSYPTGPEYAYWDEAVPSISNNTFASYGIYTGEGDLTLGDVGKYIVSENGKSYWMDRGVTFSSSIENIRIKNDFITATEKKPVAIMNTFESAAIYTNNMTVNGNFN